MHPSVKAVCDYLWAGLLADSPEFGTYIGHDVDPAGMDSYTVEAYEQRKALAEEVLRQADAIDPASDLSDEDHINISLLRRYALICIEGISLRQYTMTMSQDLGLHLTFHIFTVKRMPFQEPEHYRNYCKRLELFPKQVREMQELMRIGIAEDITVPKCSIGSIGDILERIITTPTRDLPYYNPFKTMPSHFPEELSESLTKEGLQLIEKGIMGTFKELQQFMREEYIPHCRPELSLSSLPPPPGKTSTSRYDTVLQFHCDTQLTGREMHELGLKQVQKLEQEIHRIMEKVGFRGTLQEFTEYLESKKENCFETDEEMYQYCEDLLAKRIRPVLAKLFHSFTSLPIKVMGAPFDPPTLGVYISPKEGEEPMGQLWLATKDLRRAKYLLMSLLLHESEPGHHYQACHTFGRDDIPNFRRYKDDRKYFEVPARFPLNTAHTEGWGLYSEELGKELDLYNDPYEEYGFLDQNIRRAVRMVIDPAIHALGWSREKAFEYMMAHAPFTAEIANREIERYISFPGQGCAYTYGLLKIREFRTMAENKLGDLFDIRDFHLACLDHGQLPLDVLEMVINRYVEQKLAQTPAK